MSARIVGGSKDGDTYQVTLIREVRIQVWVSIDEDGTRIVERDCVNQYPLRELTPEERHLCKVAAHDLKEGAK
jgi:hypothetical protein